MKTAILAIILFGFLIFPHELGHFIAARIFGIRVNEFAFGMGPAIWQKQGKETLYSIRILPIGGYNAMEGEDGESEHEDAFCHKPWYAKIVVLFAGSFMNIMIAILVLSIMFGIIGFSTTSIKETTQGSPAEAAGITAGDEITQIGNQKIDSWNDIGVALQKSEGKEVTVRLERDGKSQTLQLTPQKEEDRYVIGILPEVTHNPALAVKGGVVGTWNMFRMILSSLHDLVTRKVSTEDVAGPVGMVNIVHQAESQGLRVFFSLLAFMSINLAIINMLPFPALDGGRIIFVIIRAITGEAITDRQEGIVHGIGMAFLLSLMILITWQDIMKLFS